MLECAFIVLWLQLGCSCRLRDEALWAHFPKDGEERERSLDTAHPRLCVGIFKYC